MPQRDSLALTFKSSENPACKWILLFFVQFSLCFKEVSNALFACYKSPVIKFMPACEFIQKHTNYGIEENIILYK